MSAELAVNSPNLEYLQAHPAFLHALLEQAALNESVFFDHRAATTAAQETVNHLNEELHEADILGEEVIAEGKAFIKPEVMYDPQSGLYAIQPTLSTDEAGLPVEERGIFYGFGFVCPGVAAPRGDEDGVESLMVYRPKLGFKLFQEEVSTPIMDGHVSTFCPLDSTTLTFLRDQQRLQVISALESLCSYEDDSISEATNSVNMLLSSAEKFTTEALHQTATCLRELFSEKDKAIGEGEITHLKDQFSQLIKARLGIDGAHVFDISCSAFLHPRPEERRISCRQGFKGQSKITDILFGPNFFIGENGEPYLKDPNSNDVALLLTIQLDGEVASILVPFEKITKLADTTNQSA